MKTCPKCKATNIPDDAMFCPKCGNPISKVSETWTQKHKELQDERTELLRQRSNLCEFEKERQNLLTTLLHTDDYASSMNENIAIIRYNRTIEPRKYRVWWILGLVLCIVFPLLIVGALLIIQNGPLFIGLLIGSIIIMPIYWNIEIEYKHVVNNKYITSFWEPFVREHISHYEYLETDFSSCTKVIEWEISEPETISQKITYKIEELNKRIKDVENQMQLMTDLNHK